MRPAIKPLPGPIPSLDDERAVERFLFHEAALLDAGRFEDWLDLFADDGIYWIPGEAGQTDPLGTVSIIYEDKPILAMRVERLGHPRIYSADPLPRTVHMVGNVTVETEGETIVATSTLIVASYRDGPTVNHHGRARHVLKMGTDDRLRILEKRVDLIDCDGIHGPIIVPL